MNCECRVCGKRYTFNDDVGYARDVCTPYCDGKESGLRLGREEAANLQLELQKFRAVAARVRQVANIVCKPHMSYSGARYEQQFDELLAGEPGDAGKALLEELRTLRLEKMQRDGLPIVSGS